MHSFLDTIHRWESRQCRDPRWDIKPLQCVLCLPQGLFLVGRTWKTSRGRFTLLVYIHHHNSPVLLFCIFLWTLIRVLGMYSKIWYFSETAHKIKTEGEKCLFSKGFHGSNYAVQGSMKRPQRREPGHQWQLMQVVSQTRRLMSFNIHAGEGKLSCWSP